MQYLLTTPDGSRLWCGPGLRRLCDGCKGRIPLWSDRASAQRAADALKAALGIDVRPEAVRAHVRR